MFHYYYNIMYHIHFVLWDNYVLIILYCENTLIVQN